MILVRTTMTLAVVALVLAMAAPAPADHDENLRTEWLEYVGTNYVVSAPIIGTFALLTPTGGCDQAGSNGAIFCDALTPDPEDENWTMPDRVHIDVRDSLGPRVGFYWEFRSGSGSVLERGFACGSVNTFVPHEEQGPENNTKTWYPNSTELRVYPDIGTSLLGRPSTTTVPSIPLGVADTINDAAPDNATVPDGVPELGGTVIGVPQIPNATPSIGIGGHPFPCGSPTVSDGRVTVDWRYNAPVWDFE